MGLFRQIPTSLSIQENRLLLGFISPKKLRLIIGILGILLPLILYVGNDFTLMGSISAYYHTNMRWFFVGYFIVLGWLLIAYRGFPGSYDDVASVFAGICAILLAIFPTSAPGEPRDIIAWLHVLFTVLFFLVLIYMAWFLFTMNPEGLWKKRIYKLAGIVMLACMIGIIIFDILETDHIIQNPTFWFEAIAFKFFGLAWLIKSI
jgi:hypothetical protein